MYLGVLKLGFISFSSLCTKVERLNTAWNVYKYGVFSGPYLDNILNYFILEVKQNLTRINWW